jgi:hypothetical protein
MAGLAWPLYAVIEVKAALRSGLGTLPADGTGLAMGLVGMVAVDAEEAPELGAQLGWGHEDLPVNLQEVGRMGGGIARSYRPVACSWGESRIGCRG